MNQASVDLTHDWLMEVDEKFKNMETIPKRKPPEKKQEKIIEKPIYNMPASIRENFNYSDYASRKVSSFGPYYHGDESCPQTEDIKQKVLFHSVKRFNKTIHDYAKPFTGGVLKNLRDAYDELDQAKPFYVAIANG